MLRTFLPQVIKVGPLQARAFHATSVSRVAVGDLIPNVKLQEDSPSHEVSSRDIFKRHKRAILIGVPGAFTPGCSKTHVPSYLTAYPELKQKGVELVACVSVNDAFVMKAWAESLGTGDKVKLLADPKAEFVKSLDLSFDATGVLGSVRSKRFALLIEDAVVKKIYVEPDNTGITCTLAQTVLKDL
ncbi:Redoxin [Basidiobolus meristosporus CBS 931.73]|uniref:Thioredoxin-dependent peroxiredoxin n=1 Tax=Basidiobolus meristosporus CBS 931.73 TaxID=1314790 RepID=A0A1Y1Z0F1_9FUNG|nr:Redoxin [Basidiobolus meristosporus CBS 931.73]|eukprot:ORY03594.1 Redoxin [Basidiobolus meristosporus CBS 931.73]